jgi:hypothetical protein
MRLLSLLSVALVVCIIAIALPAAPAQAQGAEIMLSPSSGVPGEEVTVYGYNFTADEWVDIYYYLDGTRTWVAEDLTDIDGDFRVDFIVPESYTGPHEVRAEDVYHIHADDDFTVEPGLIVSPEEGPVGTTVTVEGQGFAEDEENIELMYYFNGDYETIEEDIPADEDGSWETSFQIPPSAHGNHRIDARGDESRLNEVEDATFEVTAGISIDESSGSVGDNITMTGSGFAADERDISILFDGEALVTDIRADDMGYWEESFEVPEMPIGEYGVAAEGERTQDLDELVFEIEPSIVLSPDEGYVGMNLTVAGRGFAANLYVSIIYEVSQVTTAKTNAKGSFDVSFPVPESQHGARLVAAEDAAKNEATAIFIMESDLPPVPELISLPDGDRVGFIARVRPTFEWSEVSDDSGVYYSLQIATSANVTATGFVDPIVSKEGLVGTNYTLEETEALPHGTYYWIVQAVDGAKNKSGWTAARSFRVGLLPMWASIVIIVAIVVFIGTLVYFFFIRRRIYY